MELTSNFRRGNKRHLSPYVSKILSETASNDGGVQQDTKRRRMDLTRKDLFTSSERTNSSVEKKITMQETLTMEVDEETQTMSPKKNYALGDQTNSISNSPYTRTRFCYTILEDTTPTKNPPRIIDPSLTNDFLQLELMCESSEAVSSISALMGDPKMASSPKTKKQVTNMLEGIVNEMKEDFMELECAQNNYVREINDVMNVRNNLFLQMKANMDLLSSTFQLPNKDKENMQHSNTELKDGLLPIKKGGKLLLSPIILRSGDLRKSTLRRNFKAQNSMTPKRRIY